MMSHEAHGVCARATTNRPKVLRNTSVKRPALDGQSRTKLGLTGSKFLMGMRGDTGARQKYCDRNIFFVRGPALPLNAERHRPGAADDICR
ncbi:hypothetical protein EVAR_76744_1 [Eumeta japonica]|uniref:Uncharacterized protein n=1 Tax=Eumeta variegata TaxID=151549 RepID=A0A4C1ST41_EUMVA|nr:hypothetical protein EVAR_76744_1 [Eumeta japonica]